MRYILSFLILLFTSPTQAEETDILKIFEHFTLASAAAGKCITPNKNELNAFLANYQMVTVMAMKEIKERKPEISKEQVNEILMTGGNKATNAVYSIIEEEGCGSPKIQDLIKRFHLQANWKP